MHAEERSRTVRQRRHRLSHRCRSGIVHRLDKPQRGPARTVIAVGASSADQNVETSAGAVGIVQTPASARLTS